MELDTDDAETYERGRGQVEPTVVEAHPCQDCQYSTRCASGLACSALMLFINTGRFSTVAPRQPNAKVYAQIYGKPEVQSVRRQSTMLAVSLLRANPCRMR